jgi:hypothetical protein
MYNPGLDSRASALEVEQQLGSTAIEKSHQQKQKQQKIINKNFVFCQCAG